MATSLSVHSRKKRSMVRRLKSSWSSIKTCKSIHYTTQLCSPQGSLDAVLPSHVPSSYLHVEWCTYHKLIRGDKRIDQKIKRYKMKQEQLGPFAEVGWGEHTHMCVYVCALMEIVWGREREGEDSKEHSRKLTAGTHCPVLYGMLLLTSCPPLPPSCTD